MREIQYCAYNVSEASKLIGISFLLGFFLKDYFAIKLLTKFQGTTFQEFSNSCFYPLELIKSDFLWKLINFKISRESLPERKVYSNYPKKMHFN